MASASASLLEIKLFIRTALVGLDLTLPVFWFQSSGLIFTPRATYLDFLFLVKRKSIGIGLLTFIFSNRGYSLTDAILILILVLNFQYKNKLNSSLANLLVINIKKAIIGNRIKLYHSL